MKKILIITLEFFPTVGGIATYVKQLAEELEQNKVVVYAPKSPDTKDWDAKQKYKIYRKNPYFPLFIWPRWLRLLWQIFWICQKEKIEVILIHHALPIGYAGWFLKKIKKIPYLIFFHGTDLAYATKNKWKIKMLRKISINSEQVIFNSKSLCNRALRILPELEKLSTVLYPCPENIFYDRSNQEAADLLKSQLALNGKKIALSVSRFIEGKGLTHLIKLMPQILKKIPHLVWVVVGDGPKKKLLFEEVQKKSLQNVIRFVGQVPHEELSKYYHLADLFILLTHPDEGREEGLGMVFLEASAASLPVVAGRSGGVEETVINNKTGLIVDALQEQTVINAIDKLANDREFARQLGKNGQMRVKQDFQWGQQVAKLNSWLFKESSINLKM